MIKSYFYLKRATYELNNLLSDSLLLSTFSQEKDKIVFQFSKDSRDVFVEISVNANSPFLSVKPDYHRAKKNSVNIFKGIDSQKLLSVKIALNERILLFELSNVSLFFLVRGKLTNIYMVSSGCVADSFKSFKKDDIDLITDALLKNEYSNNLSFSIQSEFDPNNRNILKSDFPHLNKEIVLECKLRGENNLNYNLILTECIYEVLNSEIFVTITKDSRDIGFSPVTFHQKEISESETFDNYFDAASYYQKKKYQHNSYNEAFKKLHIYFENELKYLSNKLNDLSVRIDKGSRDAEFSKIAQLLLISIEEIRKGSKEIIVEDIYSNGELFPIMLKENLSAKGNVDYYFSKARSERINFEKSKELFAQTKKRFEILILKKELFLKSESLEELRKIMSELNLNSAKLNNVKDDLSQSFKRYLIEDKYEFFVGKDSRSNDQLTMKFAKPNDYWFHARSVPGSHCLLKVHNTKEPVPKNVLKKAAALAAFHSKAKTAGVVPVSYTFKKYVTKKKGMDVGQVILLKEDVLLVKPEIPSGVEFISSEN
jgi:predicted ribosome quality control (RQC) complex YloA/Tae2 family protein